MERPSLRKLPISRKALFWPHGRAEFAFPDRRFKMIRAALILGFAFLLMARRDFGILNGSIYKSIGNGNPYRICIQKSKTGQEGRGVFRSLFRNGASLCHRDNCENYAQEIVFANRDSHPFVFRRNIIYAERATIKRIAGALGLNAVYFSLHSLRSGGASSIFLNGVELGVIRIFGQWMPSRLHIYLYGGSLKFRNLSSSLRHDNNLTVQIKMPTDLRAGNVYDGRRKLGRCGLFLRRVCGCASGASQGTPDKSDHCPPRIKSDSATGALMGNDSLSSSSYLATAVFSESSGASDEKDINAHGASSRRTLVCGANAPSTEGGCTGDERTTWNAAAIP